MEGLASKINDIVVINQIPIIALIVILGVNIIIGVVGAVVGKFKIVNLFSLIGSLFAPLGVIAGSIAIESNH